MEHCKFCGTQVPVKQQEESNGLLKKGEKFLAGHEGPRGPCVHGSGLLISDNQKPLEPFDMHLWTGFVAQT